MRSRAYRTCARFVFGLLLPALFLMGGRVAEGTESGGEPVHAEILYISRSFVYIDKGEADGLTPDSELKVYRGGQEIGYLQVSYLSQHSASCQIVTVDGALDPGDEVRFLPVPPPPEPPEPVETEILVEEPPVIKPLRLPPQSPQFRLKGFAALEWKAFADAENTNEDFQQPSLSMKLDGERLWNRPFEFHLRIRSKYNRRSREFDLDRPETEWLHRFYRVSLTYSDPDVPLAVTVGRLYNNKVQGAGNWDGALLEYRLGNSWTLGAFGGGEPGLTDSKPDFDQMKWGGYVHLTSGLKGLRRYTGTFAVVGQYSSGEVSREYAVLQNRLFFGRRLGIRQNLELDINRDWRKEMAGEDQTLSRFNILLQSRFGERADIDVGYDYYKNVRRIETQAIPDSLFYDPRLQGYRLGARYRLSQSLRCSGRVGFRDREDVEKRPVFWNAGLNWSDFLGSGAYLQMHYAYSDGRYTQSHAPSIDLQRRFGRAIQIGLGLGVQSYEGVDRETLTADGQWLRLYGSYLLARRIDLQWLYSFAAGDIGAGNRILLRLGYRL